MAEPNVVQPFDPFAEFERMTNTESGGGGTVALCHISYGYKSYAAGMAGESQGDTFFPFVPSLNDSNGQAAVAKASAEAYNTLHQCPKPIRVGIQIKANRDGALSQGKPVTWSIEARYFNTDGWTEACKEVVNPSLKANGILTFPWTGWARLGFKPDPYKQKMGEAGKTDHDQSGNPRFPQVAYVVEVFPDEASAKASAASDAPVAASPNGTEQAWKPESDGWKAEDLQAIGTQLAEELKTKPLSQVAADYGMTVSDALVALGEHRTKLPPVAVAGKYKVDVSEVSKVRDAAERIPF